MTPSESSIPSDDQTTNQAESRQHQKTRRGALWVLLLVVLMGSIGAGAGYKALSVQYESKVLVRIAPVLPNILKDTNRSEVMPLYDSYVNTQMLVIKSRRIAEDARENSAPIHFIDPAEIQESVSVYRPEQSQAIVIAYAGATPAIATAGADAVADAYVELRLRVEHFEHHHRLYTLRERADVLKKELESERHSLVVSRHEFETEFSAAWHDLEAQLQSGLDAAGAMPSRAIATDRNGTGTGLVSAVNGARAGEPSIKLAKVEEPVQAVERAEALSLDAREKEAELEVKRMEVERLQKQLDMIQERIVELELEESAGARVSVLSPAETPIRPSNTSTRVGVAGLGAVGGVLLALALVTVLRRRWAAAS